jgi:peptide chain release factor 1
MATDNASSPSPQPPMPPHQQQQRLAQLNKELSKMQPIVQAIQQFQSTKKELHQLDTLIAEVTDDKEMKQLAEAEKQGLLVQLPELEKTVLLSLLPDDPDDERDIVLEIKAGIGGDEAALFASELFQMYEKYCSVQRGWRWEEIEMSTTEGGGVKSASATISGPGAYGKLKFESGVHRVQRVPTTEKQGRLHTSAVSVAVLPQADEVEMDVKNEDLRVDTFRASGKGGQHVNTTNSAVRITHIPTGFSVAIQDERSQHQNKAKALKLLRARLYEVERVKKESERTSNRRALLGSGDRSDKVRTYHFPQGRVTDHRVGITEHNIERIMGGDGLDSFIDALKVAEQNELLASVLEEEGE